MQYDENEILSYIGDLTEDSTLIDQLPDELVDILIQYLKAEIENKENLLNELQEKQN